MPDISVVDCFDQSLIEQVGAFLPEEESEALLAYVNQSIQTSDNVVDAYTVAHAFVAGRAYAIINDALDAFPVLMSREELQDYHEFLRERNKS